MQLSDLIQAFTPFIIPNCDEIDQQLSDRYSLVEIDRTECNECEYSGYVEYHLHRLGIPVAILIAEYTDGCLDDVEIRDIFTKYQFEFFISEIRDAVSLECGKLTFSEY